MCQIYNDKTRTPEPKENKQGILGISSQRIQAFWQKFSRGPWVEERALLALHIYGNAHKKLLHFPLKSCCNFICWFKEEHSWNTVVTQLRSVSRIHANTLSPDVFKLKFGHERWTKNLGMEQVIMKLLYNERQLVAIATGVQGQNPWLKNQYFFALKTPLCESYYSFMQTP